jgi:hypothetical protein
MRCRFLIYTLGGVCALLARCSPGGADIAGTNVNTGNARVSISARYADGRPAAGASVRLRPAGYLADTAQDAAMPRGAPVIDTVTDPDGAVELLVGDTGALMIEVRDEHAYGYVKNLRIETPEETVPLGKVTLGPPGALTGAVRAASGEPAPAFVRIYGLERIAPVDAATGRFAFDDIPEGEYTVQIVPRSANLSNASAAASVGAGGAADIDTVTLTTFEGEEYGDWAHARPVHFNTSASGANVAGTVARFPALIRLDASRFAFDQARGNGEDLRFSAPHGAHLRYEIDFWDSAGAAAAVWVLLDTLHGMSDSQFVTMHWGNPSARSFSNGASVFGAHNGYGAVWHMEARSHRALVPDISGAGAHGIAHGGVAGERAHIGGGQAFDGTDDYLDCGNGPGVDLAGELSLSLWLRVADPSADEYYRAISKKSPWDAPGGYELEINPVHHDKGYSTLVGGDTTFARAFIQGGWDARWHYCAVTARMEEGVVFLDGVEIIKPSQKAIHAIVSSPASLLIGGREGVDRLGRSYADYFYGTLDEVRLSTVARGADWIRLCYENQKADQTLVEMR